MIFRKIADTERFTINFEELELANRVVSEIKDNNSLEVDNSYNPYRAKDGKFTTGPSRDSDDGSKELKPIDSVNPTGGLLVEYTPKDRAKAPLADNMTTLAETAGKKPDDTLTIYRGAPKNQKSIVAGDYITDMRELAESYTGDGNVISKEVRYGDVLDDRNEPLGNEYIYRPGADKGIAKSKNSNSHKHPRDLLDIAYNQLDSNSMGIVTQQQGALQNVVVDIETRVVSSVFNSVTKNAFEENSDIITDEEREQHERDLILAISAFYFIVVPLFASKIINDRAKEFGLTAGAYVLTQDARSYIQDIATRASMSHINTIVGDLRTTIKNTYDSIVNKELDAIKTTGRAVTDADLVLARKKALEGASQQEIINSVKNEYKDITTNRAKAIARTETNRAFTQSQYQADLQFLQENDLLGKAYKQWFTRSAEPCRICVDLSNQPPIPFERNFADLGDELIVTYTEDGKTKVKKQLVNFEELKAGNAHVNCACVYKLIIK